MFISKNPVLMVLIFCLFFLTMNCGGAASSADDDTVVATYDINVQLSGLGLGGVTSSPTGIDCGEDCTQTFDDQTEVTLMATATDGYVFAGWLGSDACSGVGPCVLTVTQDENLTAPFNGILYTSRRGLSGTDSLNTSSVLNIWTMKTDGSDAVALTDNTATGIVNTQPQWSPDRSMIVYRSNQALDGSDALNTNSTTNIWVMNNDGSSATPLTNLTADNADSSSPSWSPDGSQIIFSSARALDGTDAANTGNTSNIWIFDNNGTGLTPLTSNTAGSSGSPTWSHDGATIAYTSTRALDGSDAVNTNTSTNLWVMNSDGSNSTPLTNNTFIESYFSVGQFSPDDSQILYSSSQALDQTDVVNTNSVMNVWVVNVADGVRTPLTSITASLASSYSPLWSPDGNSILFNSPRSIDGSDSYGTNGNLWVMDADGSHLTLVTSLTATNVSATDARWTPDGNSILYRSNRAVDGTDSANTNDVYNIWFSSPDGTTANAVTNLTTDDADSFLPSL